MKKKKRNHAHDVAPEKHSNTGTRKFMQGKCERATYIRGRHFLHFGLCQHMLLMLMSFDRQNQGN